ncbi:alcohol dehydrogenase [Capronia coronata CBS 617.96]|uniref:Alcohol dehydrogenase n=1 Tax=Capronia coronata CBS 617.96 TaxID=1182541 RepID=W9Z375_9EURO|nr:alcohol dehydrogenase [Capronia coronata CBS 617.96]EXJ96395.1 alcohol dehydrogenase [Capronia coronata CBS 617.96]
MASVEVPARHKAIVYDNPGTVSAKIEEIDTPKPGVGEVLLNITHSGVCHSDYGVMTNAWSTLPFPTQKGQVGGHEGVGKIVALGSGTEGSGLKIGDRVGIKWVAGVCGNCIPCLDGADANCTSVKISGYYTPGTFQQYALAPANYVTPVPDSLPSDIAAPMMCGGVTVFSALSKSGAKPGDWVVIPGSGGGLGHLALQIGARGMGFRMIGIDMGEKEQLSRDCGAEVFLDLSNYSRDDDGTNKLVEDVKAATGGFGAAAVVICTASNAAYAQGLKFLRFRGTLVCVGVPEGDPVPIATANPGVILTHELRIVGSAVGNRKDAIDTLAMAARGIVKTHVEIQPMSKLIEVFERMEKGKLQGRVVLDLSG